MNTRPKLRESGMEKHIILISKLPTDSASKICTQSLFFSLGKNSETSTYDKTRRRDETCCPRTLDICNMSLEEPHLLGSFILRSKGINLDKCQRWQSNFSQRFYRCLCTHTHTHTHVHTHTHTRKPIKKSNLVSRSNPLIVTLQKQILWFESPSSILLCWNS